MRNGDVQQQRRSQEAVFAGHIGEAVEGVVGAGAGAELGCAAHRARNHLPGELWVDVLGVCWASLQKARQEVTVKEKFICITS